MPAGPNLWGNVLAALTAVAHLPGHCLISAAQYMQAGQQQRNTELSLPLASSVLPHPQMRKTPHARSSTCHFLMWSVYTSTNVHQLSSFMKGGWVYDSGYSFFHLGAASEETIRA